MSTKDEILFLTKKSVTNDNFDPFKNDNQYSNLNLNQSFKCSNLSPIFHFQSKSFKDKNFVSQNYNGKEKSQVWNKSSKASNYLISNNESEKDAKKSWKNESSSNTNKSTLSIHIGVYENSTKAVTADSFGVKKEGLIKKQGHGNQILTPSTFITQNPFEFPRQQKSEVLEPEVSQYKTSQQFINPNESGNNGQQGKPIQNSVKFYCLITSGIMAAFFALASIVTGIFVFVRQ